MVCRCSTLATWQLAAFLCVTWVLEAFASDAMPRSPSAGAFQRRVLRKARPAVPQACKSITCPSTSKCRAPNGLPICVCPGANTRLVPSPANNRTYVCSSASVDHADYLDPYNAARAAVRSPPLTWSASLAALAQKWANNLRNTQSCSPDFGNHKGYGQNVIAAVAENPQNGTVAVNAWISNGLMYKLALFAPPGASGCTTGNWEDCSPYIQLVWQYTARVGCATATCPPKQVWVCNYDPPGQLSGLYPYSPCAQATCPAKQVCDPYLGLGAPCVASPCTQVRCPAGATCALSDDSTPYCTCGAGFSMVNQTCIQTPSDSSLPQTTVVLYSQTQFRGPAVVIRPFISPPNRISCVQLPESITKGGLLSLKVLWWTGDASGKLPTLSKPAGCQLLAFWNQTGCVGSSAVYSPTPGFPTASEVDATGFIRGAKSIQCDP